MKRLCGVHQNQLVLLLVAAVVTALDPSHNLANERTSIERTYELTKYLEHQLKEIKDTYLSYLGPPFNEKDFSPPRPNSTALSLPSAATRLELWRGLENRARLAQNQRAYSVLLAAVRELARSTLCPYLQTSLLHFCTGLDGLLGSISGLMTTLGYALPPPSANTGSSGGELLPRKEAGADGGRSGPAPLMSQSLYKARAGTRAESGQRDNQRRSGTRVVRGEREDGARRETMDKKRGKEGRRAEAAGAGGRSGGSREKGRGERGRRGRRGEPESWRWGEEERLGEEEEEEELEREGGTERWGGGRRLLSVMEDEEEPTVSESSSSIQTNNNNNNNNNNQYSYNLDLLSQHQDAPREEDAVNAERGRGYLAEEERESTSLLSSSSSIRSPRSLLSPTLHPPPLSTLSLLYPFGVGEEHTLLSSPLLSVRPTLNDFSRKVEGFWILRELQSWLWRSAKDFNRLKKRLRG
ncbi:uncharacterized protein clcf1 isoform X2 [Centroberyx affinis]|uniref:uncharacterized protein clcf1 isoform X2 n=1 Tax=Centroberyx affinis TaxID=166261 RepID=UPI003A5BDCE0